MEHILLYPSPLGELLLAADGDALIGVWFEGQRYYANGLTETALRSETPVLRATADWLEHYFSRSPLPALPPLRPMGSDFRCRVWQELLAIPYGSTTTYGALASRLCSSARAVGTAVGHNPISILIPCHRVLGSGGSLTGYAGGLDRKRALLSLEGMEHPLDK